MTHEAIIEEAARALEKFRQSLVFSPNAESVAQVVITAVTPLIEAAALERAAEVAEVVPIIAARIRALISPSQSPSADSA